MEYARTVNSLENLLKNTFPGSEITKINSREAELNTANFREADVVYMTRLHWERGGEIKREWTGLNPLRYMKNKSILLHKLPRNGEPSIECDSDPRAAYWRQVKNGFYLRMALLKMILHP